jgi:hypothetical protein
MGFCKNFFGGEMWFYYRAKVGEGFVIKETLEQTIDAAVALVNKK